MSLDLVPLVDGGLGNSAYLVGLGDGRALAVDASRDLRLLRTEATRRGWAIAYAADTHLHADFLTGAVDLAAGGATVVASAAGNREFPHRGLLDEDEIDLGGLTLRALATPGHTDEHVSYLLLDGGHPVGVFTGGSLIVGAAARTDLIRPDRTEELARAQWRSLQRLVTLPDETAVWPTHGAGSFCSAPPGAERTTTIGREKATNSLLRAGNEDAFVTALLAGLGTYPPYFLRLGELNRRGPDPVAAAPALVSLDPEAVASAVALGALLVDVRPVDAYAAGHIQGAVSIPLREAFATWLGWVVDASAPLVFVRDVDQDPNEIVWQAIKVGHQLFAGDLAGGMNAWHAAGHAVTTTALVGVGDLQGRAVLDVRQRSEYTAGHLPVARNIELGNLAHPEVPSVAAGAAVMCGHGERAMTAASLLERAGHTDLAVVLGGPADWAAATGHALTTGSLLPEPVPAST